MEGEWSSFSGVYVNEEADFMAQLFPSNSSSMADEDPSLFNAAAAANSNLYCSFSQDTGNCYSGGSGIANYPPHPDNYYVECDHNTAMLLEFREDKADQLEESDEAEHAQNHSKMSAKRESDDDKTGHSSRKRTRVSDVPKGKRGAYKTKKRQKGGLVEEDNNGGINRQSSSGCSSEDESNLSLDLNNGAICSTGRASNGKTRASRGSATDPQSLYARKRRERINERLRILQNLVPNGTKVDISTMLEEAVQYVKFLQLQIKLLSSDDLWMYAPIAYNGMDIGLDLKISAAAAAAAMS